MDRWELEQKAWKWLRNATGTFSLEDAFIAGAELRQKEIDELEDEIHTLETKIESLNEEVEELEWSNDDLEDDVRFLTKGIKNWTARKTTDFEVRLRVLNELLK